jgi:hypothetical protein
VSQLVLKHANLFFQLFLYMFRHFAMIREARGGPARATLFRVADFRACGSLSRVRTRGRP